MTDTLVAVGFQRQEGLDPFPPTRPMLEGSLREEGEVFWIHLHVIPLGDPEIEEMRAFRDRLRADPGLSEAYVAAKSRIVEEGVPDSLEYSYRKGVFVVETLRAMGFPVERNTLRPPQNSVSGAGGILRHGDRARRGASGALYPQSARAGLNARPRPGGPKAAPGTER